MQWFFPAPYCLFAGFYVNLRLINAFLMQVRFLHTPILWLFLLVPMLGFATNPKDNAPRKDRKAIAEAVPMPDALSPAAKKNQNLPSASEALSPNGLDLIHREGIDVSHYQGEIDWQEVADRGEIGYVYIKASEGSGLVDDYYEYNLHEARKAGLKVGSYHFFRSNVPFEDQFRNMTAQINKSEQDLLPIVDVERINGMSTQEFVSYLKEFLKAVTKHYGRRPVLYTFVNFYNQYLQGEGFEQYPLMIAFYRDAQPELNDGHRYVIWQFTSHSRIPGIHGNVDKSKLMEGFTIEDLLF